MTDPGPYGQPEGYRPRNPHEEEGRRLEEEVEHETYGEADFEENELQAAGQTCARCGRAIAPGDEVRRTASGGYQHEVCPA
ncbi:MAG TPA: hypothetical protein VLL69_07620 [Streptosporangiaceae bacterium]|nr:hypothetical protein [Streptosporangiaceae bacterium]